MIIIITVYSVRDTHLGIFFTKTIHLPPYLYSLNSLSPWKSFNHQVFTATAFAYAERLQYSQKLKLQKAVWTFWRTKTSTLSTFHNQVGVIDKGSWRAKQTEELNKKEAGKVGDGQGWSMAADRKTVSTPNSMNCLTKPVGLNFDYKANTLIFHTSFMEPGFNIGIASKSASINGDFTLAGRS